MSNLSYFESQSKTEREVILATDAYFLLILSPLVIVDSLHTTPSTYTPRITEGRKSDGAYMDGVCNSGLMELQVQLAELNSRISYHFSNAQEHSLKLKCHNSVPGSNSALLQVELQIRNYTGKDQRTCLRIGFMEKPKRERKNRGQRRTPVVSESS